MNIEPNPSAQMPIGKARHVAGAPEGACELFEGGEFMGDVFAGCLSPGSEIRLQCGSAQRNRSWGPSCLIAATPFELRHEGKAEFG